VLKPNSKPIALAHKIDIDEKFKSFAEKIMCTFNVGVDSLISEKKKLEELMDSNSEDYKKIVADLTEDPGKMLGLRAENGDEIVIVNENNDIVVKILKIEHKGKNNKSSKFSLKEESDGTIRLLDFVPVFRDINTYDKVYIIDEIERSIHPLLIKELITKFSSEKQSTGQLIFSTHESNLLDQSIFRQDEIWFVEKDKTGATDLYSLSDFNVHKTKNIQKGYLNGRYGSIPFLSNLIDLNWNNYDFKE
jgi:hypothetical protein